jgi:glycyl-tRNA synthetase
MFKTSIGPNGNLVGFLRPETAQGIFVNFGKLLEYNGGRMPFASAQIGLGFRNEIAPRNGLLRVREFQMAEIEHFVDPADKSHPKFKNYRNLKLPLLSQPAQVDGKGLEWTEIGGAVDNKTVHNETLGYFLARIYLFLIDIGVDKNLIRFRQLSSTERAHYAQDCWDV